MATTRAFLRSNSSPSGLPPPIGLSSTIVVLFVLWWGANNAYVVDAHIFFHAYPSFSHILYLVTAQIVTALLYAQFHHVITVLFNQSTTTTPTNSPIANSLSAVFTRRAPLLLGIATLHTVGSALTTASIASIGGPGTLLWKLTEPLPTLILNATLLGRAVSLRSTMAVMTVLSGVILFSANSAKSVSFVPIISANVVFPLRNALVKLADNNNSNNNEKAVSKIQRFCNIMVFSLPVLIVAFVVQFFMIPSLSSSAKQAPVLLYFRNASLFNAYQFASISLLALVDTVTHSLLNTFKRFTGVILTMLLLQRDMRIHHLAGMSLAFVGFLLYLLSEQKLSCSVATRYDHILRPVSVAVMPLLITASLAYTLQSQYILQTPGSDELLFDGSLGAFSDGYMAESTKEYINPKARKYTHFLVNVPDYQDSVSPSTHRHTVRGALWRMALEQRIAEFPGDRKLFRTCNSGALKCISELDSIKARDVIVHFVTGVVDYAATPVLLNDVSKYASMPRVKQVLLFQYSVGGNRTSEIGRNNTVSDSSVELLQTNGRLSALSASKRTLQTLTRHRVPVHMMDSICPAHFIGTDGRLGRTVASRLRTVQERVSQSTSHDCTGSNMNNCSSTHRKWITPGLKIGIVGKFAYLSKHPGVLQTLQNNFNVTFYARRRGNSDLPSETEISAAAIRNHVQGGYGLVDALRAVDLALCETTDDAIAAMSAGRVGVVVTEDEVEIELANSCSVPVVRKSQLWTEWALDLTAVMDEVRFNGNELDHMRCRAAQILRQVYGDVGLDVKPVVKACSIMCESTV